VKTLTSSGISAPAIVPQVMIVESFHQSVESPPSVGIRTATGRSHDDGDDGSQPHQRGQGISKLNLGALPNLALAQAH